MILQSVSFLLLLLQVLQVQIGVVDGRPIVRNIRSTHEFDRLLKKHTEETGLPVIVDFYSDSCGPCRMMAPIFKKVAQSVEDQAVFVKIDTNAQYELSSRYQIRSLPTFMFFLGDSRKPHSTATGGIGEQNLRDRTRQLITQSEIENVKIEYDDFATYYGQVDPNKTPEEIQSLYDKCAKMNKSKFCLGSAANSLVRKLNKKYKAKPETKKRYEPQPKRDQESEEGPSSVPSTSPTTTTTKKSRGSSSKPNLHLATKDELMEELEKRLDEERDQQVEGEDEDEEEIDPDYKQWTKSDFPERVVIVGGGPAGMAAAIYASRAGLQPLVIAPAMGGQLQGKGVDVENYPGLHNLTGPAVIGQMRSQALHFGAFFEDDIITKVDVPSSTDEYKPLTIHTNETGIIETHTLIVATGAESKWLDIPGEYEMRGGGVSSCATCDGFLFSNQNVIVIGGGDTAMEDALVLARTSKTVTLIHRRDSLRASKVLADRVINHPSIQIRWNTTVSKINGKYISIGDDESKQQQPEDDKEELDLDEVDEKQAANDATRQKVVTGVVLKDVTTMEETNFDCDAVFIAIGHTPTTNFLEGVVEFDPNHPGYILSKSNHNNPSTHTSVNGIFAAGDVSDPIYRQAITSAGTGAAAALDAERYLSENGLGNEAALFEAELLAELMMDEEDAPAAAGGYNAYADVAGAGVGVKESFRTEL